MRIRIALATALMLLVGVSNADILETGRILSSDFLSRMMAARASRTEIAVIHQEAAAAILVNAEDPSKAVMQIRSHDNFLWSQIAEQLPAALSAEKPLRLELETRTIESKSCASLDRKLAEFLQRDRSRCRAGRSGDSSPCTPREFDLLHA